jgi:hypothetical protein
MFGGDLKKSRSLKLGEGRGFGYGDRKRMQPYVVSVDCRLMWRTLKCSLEKSLGDSYQAWRMLEGLRELEISPEVEIRA